jgi:chromosome segregation ATPase
MGLFGDFFRFFTSTLIGGQDPSKKFMEGITMGERYLRWGEERGDGRDFQAAIKHLEAANDANAPKPEMVLRKYELLADAALGQVQVLMKGHRDLVSKATKSKNELAADQQTLREQIDATRKRMRALTEEGSLLKAKEEEKHIADLQSRLNHIGKVLEGGEDVVKLQMDYSSMSEEAERLCQRVEDAVMALASSQNVSASQSAPVRNAILERLGKTRDEVAGLRPMGASSR